MKGLFFAIGALLSFGIYAQPQCFIAGFNYSSMTTNIKNYSFQRTLANDPTTGNPYTEFTNLKDQKIVGSSAGLNFDIYTKHWRIASDINIPFKKSYSNFFNFNIAYGGYIKDKIGVLGGIVYYRNTKKANYVPAQDPTPYAPQFKEHTFNTDVKENGLYYFNGVPVHSAGFNALLTYAPAENFVVRVDYAFMLSNILHQKDVETEGYDWDQDKSRKLEVGLVWQISDNFGLGVKYLTWNVKGQYKTDYNYNGFPNVNGDVLIDIIPQREYNMKSFMVSLMFPTGTATSRKTVVQWEILN